MPELPEVETTRRGIAPHLLGVAVASVSVRAPRLRWPVAEEIRALPGWRIVAVGRRAKYLLIGCSRPANGGPSDQPAGSADAGTLIIHLGMSGSLRIADPATPLRPHDHIVLGLASGRELRYHDPRRFGAWLWTAADPAAHPLLRDLGPEPLDDVFTDDWLWRAGRNRTTAVKPFIMDARVVVGVGNIYACEALHLAGIDPRRAVGGLSAARLRRLAGAIRAVLNESIQQGGTTLRDFLREDGSPGYFSQHLRVYDRAGAACPACGTQIRRLVLGGRSTFFCPRCQR
jgi:formamidopyrimidine-DNA glycosylase